ncbi:CLUMA_CG002693, isoform A [Clunio marinus]|uniref:CLUMA_CG002693, isoform A n=1 Tax=Clunio marinus TaxID=568069 RepID=A0A1J1HS55_9DIPT|nr:CLUMA_CG002693, isoform A [Clunio marinus]
MEIKLIILTCFLLFSSVKSDSSVVYPESDTNENRKPQSHMRQPVTSSKCGEGELLYPGDTAGDWTCDCRPTFLYDPRMMKCYRAYSKGPCQANEIFCLPKSSFIPKCEQNICGPGRVLFNNVCATIDGFEGCKQPSPGRNTHRLLVDATTMQLHCSFLTPSRSPEPIDEQEGIYETKACFIGGKRSQQGLCPTSE